MCHLFHSSDHRNPFKNYKRHICGGVSNDRIYIVRNSNQLNGNSTPSHTIRSTYIFHVLRTVLKGFFVFRSFFLFLGNGTIAARSLCLLLTYSQAVHMNRNRYYVFYFMLVMYTIFNMFGFLPII